jgi:maleylacetoacetate isomerase/maleylpyruvate isomerase
VRIALNLKGLPFDYVPIHLVKNEQLATEFLTINPSALVPVLDERGTAITQSLAICEYLEEVYPEPSLLPDDPIGRARVRALALTIACEIHPLNNLRVLKYLTRELGVAEDAKDLWYRHWVESGLAAFEALLDHEPQSGPYCHGSEPTLADICLIPQVFNAQRFKCDLSKVPRILAVYHTCMQLDAFKHAAPAEQPDAA